MTKLTGALAVSLTFGIPVSVSAQIHAGLLGGLSVAGFLAVPTAPLQAQEPLPVMRGARVRVKTECVQGDRGKVCPRYQGTFDGITPDSIVLRADDTAGLLALPLASVTQVETNRGRTGHPWRGASIGFVIGAAGGGIVLFAYDIDCQDPMGELGGWTGCAAAVAVPAVVSGLVGIGIGALIKTDRWEEVPFERLRVQPVATVDGRFGLAASVSF